MKTQNRRVRVELQVILGKTFWKQEEKGKEIGKKDWIQNWNKLSRRDI